MHTLPIVERELRVASRRPRTYFGRLSAAGVAVVFTAYLYWMFSHFGGQAAGRQMFTMLVQLAFIYCLFSGVGNTADCLSREKREGTMGFLFLTQLRGYDIVLGKLLATSLSALYGVLAIVPVFALCLLTGGVQPGEFWRMMLAIFNALFFSLAVGLAVSACSRQERKATQTAAGIMVVFGLVLPALGEYLRIKAQLPAWSLFLKTLSPTQTLDFSTIPTASVRFFWYSLVTVHLLGWLALGGACWILPRSWQDRPAKPHSGTWRERSENWLRGFSSRRGRFRARRLQRNPFYWLAARNPLTVVETWTVLAAAVSLAAWAGWFFRTIIPVFVICMITAVILQAVMKMQVCAAACERLAEDKRTGNLEIILSTRLSVREILRGQWLALIRQFTLPASAVLLLCGLMLGLVLAKRESDFIPNSEAAVNCVLACLAASAMLLADLVALGWVGMWEALRAPHVMQARSRALFFILFLPWIALGLVLSLFAVKRAMGAWPWAEELKFPYLLGTWFLFGITNNVIFSAIALRNLRQDFRVLATER
jgi:ABC-type Na+ efflux pump permease subunit